MQILRIAIALGLMAVPALAQSIDLPRLTWPTETTAPTSQACADPTTLGALTDCTGK